MAGNRDLKKEMTAKEIFFATPPVPIPEEGIREMAPTLPFIISGGENTEKYYFQGISAHTSYKFNVKPEYFGNESRYYERFPEIIEQFILPGNPDASIFCVFDLDTLYSGKTTQENHQAFLEKVDQLKESFPESSIALCPSMPSIEYWFLLHFEDTNRLIKSNGKSMEKALKPYMGGYFQQTARAPKGCAASQKMLIDMLKDAKYIEDGEWVKKLCTDGKLDQAIQRAEQHINEAEAAHDLKEHSYSYVYLAFKNHK